MNDYGVESMKAVILAGGFGTRLSEYTDLLPKPMVFVGDKPAILHIMDHYSSFGVSEFVIAAGYKSEQIKSFFMGLATRYDSIEVDVSSQEYTKIGEKGSRDWRVSIVETGKDSMTGGRLLRLKDLVHNERFLLTYGDGFSNVNIEKLVKKHSESGLLATVTAVRPAARFGELVISEQKVESFKEKPQLDQGWINGGYFVMEPEIFEYLENDSTVLEQEPLANLASQGKLGAYRHEGFWQCMDTKRDLEYLRELWVKGDAPWAPKSS